MLLAVWVRFRSSNCFPCSARQLIHPTVADTSVVFPHKQGPPYKKGLKVLCQDYLKRFIQDDGESPAGTLVAEWSEVEGR